MELNIYERNVEHNENEYFNKIDNEVYNYMDNKTEGKITMLTIKEAAALVHGLTEYRVRQMCINDQMPHIMAGRKYLINKDIFLAHFRGKISS